MNTLSICDISCEFTPASWICTYEVVKQILLRKHFFASYHIVCD
jgi:hypothetical protein